MPIVNVQLLAGRPRRQRDTLAARLSQAVVETLEVEPASVRVLLHEVAAEDWFVGGRALSRPRPQPKTRRR